MMVDLDGPKQVNTARGHLAGDRLIQTRGHLLESALRAEDLIAGFGGDEFCVMLTGLDQDQAGATTERVRVAARSNQLHGVGIPLVVTIGLTLVTGQDDMDNAISRADRGLCAARQAGKNRIHIVQPAACATSPAAATVESGGPDPW